MAVDRVEDPTRPLEPDTSLPELLSRLSSDFGELVSTQVELAKVEIKEEIARAGKGAGLLGGGAFVAYLAVILLSFAAGFLSISATVMSAFDIARLEVTERTEDDPAE